MCEAVGESQNPLRDVLSDAASVAADTVNLGRGRGIEEVVAGEVESRLGGTPPRWCMNDCSPRTGKAIAEKPGR